MTYNELYSLYSDLWFTTRRLRKSNLIGKLRAIPYRKRRNKCAKMIFESISAQTKFPNLMEKGDPSFVVSLTSYPARISTLHLAIKSILNQEMLPSKILLYLYKPQFPNGLNDLPKNLLALQPNGLEISFLDGVDIRPHMKYHSAFQQYSDKVVVTVDDDMIYPPNTISRLWSIHEVHPNAVCTNRMRRIQFDENGNSMTYTKWDRPVFDTSSESMLYLAMGYAGVLYPPKSYTDVLFDKKLLMELSPIADDLWLKANQVVNGVPVAVAKGGCIHPLQLDNTQALALNNVNTGDHKNDEQWANLDRHFGLNSILLNNDNK